MTAGIDGSPGYRHGDLITVAGLPLRVVQHEDQWVEGSPPDSAVGFTVHQDQIDEPLKIGSLFTGYGGLDQAARAVFGGELAWMCDNHPSAATLLQHRHPEVPNLDDITAIDWEQVEPVDVLAAGFPCQDISPAGKGAGIEGARSGLWSHVVDAVRVLRPRHVVLENVADLLVRGLDRVAADLATLRYDLRWTCVQASDVGAAHRRNRWFGYATPTDTDSGGQQRHTERHSEPFGAWQGAFGLDADRRVLDWGQFEPAIRRWENVLGRPAPEPTQPGTRGNRVLSPRFVEWLMGLPTGWVTGVPGLSRAQQLRLLGNGVVPQQGEAAIRHLLRLGALVRAA